MNLSRRTLSIALAAGSTSLLTSCGTILYPDRRTSREDETMSGDIDFLILGLDAVGLFFFIIPGIIAFAVDFGTGAVFLPEGGEQMDKNERTVFDDMNEQARINTPVRSEELVRVLQEKTGKDIYGKEVLAMRMNDLREAKKIYARLSSNKQRAIT